MRVFDEIAQKFVPSLKCKKIVVKHIPGNLIFGYSGRTSTIVRFLAYVNNMYSFYDGDYELLKDVLVFSVLRGVYISTVDFPQDSLIREQYEKGQGEFPYRFERRYEAIESFNIFKNKQVILHPEEFSIAKYLKYSFGLEFETSMGYIPENICFRDGLIPLRDGSISGLEYSTVVMKGNTGLSLLRQQLDTLRQYTAFNKECSLHIHFGGYPLTPDTVFNLYFVCRTLEPAFENILPPETFYTSNYKENGKDYCRKLPSFRNFDNLYESLVGRKFYGSFTQPHPNDIRREAKWRIPTRYYWVNFINALCYNVNKTIEFRFLRPTYNFEKILIWICILNAIMIYSETCEIKEVSAAYSPNLLRSILQAVYPEPEASYIINGVNKLRILCCNQCRNGDKIGRDVEFEDALFNAN